MLLLFAGGATVDGSVMTSHSNDCVDCDWRMVYVPAKDHKKGSLRPVLDASRSAYPRLVDPGRSKQYQPDLGFESSTVLGYVPQVEHTYGLWEASYAMMNEKGLTIGESTCAAYLVGNVTDGTGVKENEHEYKHGALFTIGNLIAIALERCETARCAVQTMGDLGSKYGFYGEDPGQPGAGEAATVADASGETWVFHISGGLPDKEGAKYEGQLGSLWAAQRVPDENVAVVANNFVIRKVDKHDTKNFMVHPGLFELAQEAGLWSGEGDFDFLKVMAPDMRHFSYTPGLPPIPLYTTLRMWHVFNAVAPSLAIEITDCAWDLPFSVPVDKKLSHLEVMDLFRTHYEGTEFDMRLGVAAGPYGSPNRAEGGMGMAAVPGQFARATSIPRTSYTQVGQTGIAHPKLWFAPDASASSIFVPFYASVLAHGDGEFDVASYGEGSSKSFDFAQEVKPAWWAFDFVANWMDESLAGRESYRDVVCAFVLLCSCVLVFLCSCCFVFLFSCRLVFLFSCLFVCLFVHLCICLCVCLCAYLFVLFCLFDCFPMPRGESKNESPRKVSNATPEREPRDCPNALLVPPVGKLNLSCDVIVVNHLSHQVIDFE